MEYSIDQPKSLSKKHKLHILIHNHHRVLFSRNSLDKKHWSCYTNATPTKWRSEKEKVCR